MAQKGVNREIVSCSICLELLEDPVTIPCGHSYCKNCIKIHWDGETNKKNYSCPQCRQTFTPRPVLKKSTVLAALVEELKKTGLQHAPADHRYAGPQVAHKLGEPSNQLQENICPRHDNVMKIFCRTDQRIICSLCSLDEHRGHDTVSAAAERTERQRELKRRRQIIQQGIQEREKDVTVLQQEVENIIRSADKAVEDSEKMLAEQIRLMEKRHSDVKQQVRSQQQTEVSRVLELQEKLEQEITELKRKNAELENLSRTKDDNQFLHNYPSESSLSEATHSSRINIRPLRHFEDVTAAVTEARDKLQDVLTQTQTNISQTVMRVKVVLPEPEPQPKTRAEFLKYSREITLDPNTANTELLLSNRNRKVRHTNKEQPYPNHPDRFTSWLQVLSRESLTGRCYWEVERRGDGINVAVAYKNISRVGGSNECGFGRNNKSWLLHFDRLFEALFHNNISTPVSGPQSSRFGVYLDHSAGILSFYSVSETMTLLHRVQTTFTQPLYAGLTVTSGSTGEFIKLK